MNAIEGLFIITTRVDLTAEKLSPLFHLANLTAAFIR
jgi:hypothetical protein